MLKRYALLLVLPAALATTGIATAKRAPGALAKKVPVCHATHSAKHPYRKIVVGTKAALAHHRQHPRDIIGTPGQPKASLQCPSAPLSAKRGGKPLTAALSPTGTNTTGSGTLLIRSNVGQGMICFQLKITGLNDVTSIDILYANGSNANQVALSLPVSQQLNSAGKETGCVTAPRALVKQILKRPENFYVLVRTTAFPSGALRGTFS